MSTVTQFTRPVCRLLGEELEAAARSVAERHGLVLRYAGGTFDDGKFTAKIALTLAPGTATAATVEKKVFDQMCVLYNCRPEHYGMKLTVRGEEWTLIGFAPSRRKFPIKLRDPKGKVMVFQEVILQKLPGWQSVADRFRVHGKDPALIEETPPIA